MEFALSELLTREDILHILQNRHLNIPNLHDLRQDELERIYKTFITPLSRRPQRSRKSIAIVPSLLKVEMEQQMDIDIPLEACSTNNDAHCHQCGDYTKINKINVLNEKRHRRQRDVYNDIIDDYQLQLSSATKRIKIHSSS